MMRALLALATLTLATHAAASEPEDWTERNQLTGDWGGARTSLEEVGVSPFLYYDAIPGVILRGGLEPGAAYVGQAYAGIALDLEQMAGLTGTTVQVSAVHRHGDSVSTEVGGIYDPMCLYGGQTLYLYELWAQQRAGAVSLKAGRLTADADFARSPLYAYSLSTAINGPIRATLLESTLSAFPYATWGARLSWSPAEHHQIKLGAYQIGADMWDYTKHGVDFGIDRDDGVSLVAQYDLGAPESRAHAFVGTIVSLYGFDELDGQGTTDRFYRVYGHADVEIAEGLSAWGMVTFSPQHQVARTPVQVSGGLHAHGLLPGREDDRTVFFATYGGLSRSLSKPGEPTRDHEVVLEVGHRFQLIRSFSIQPSLQYVANPGGTHTVDDAVIAGAWIAASL